MQVATGASVGAVFVLKEQSAQLRLATELPDAVSVIAFDSMTAHASPESPAQLSLHHQVTIIVMIIVVIVITVMLF